MHVGTLVKLTVLIISADWNQTPAALLNLLPIEVISIANSY